MQLTDGTLAVNLDGQLLEDSPKTWQSKNHLAIPNVDIVSFAFARLDQIDSRKPLYIDAKNPARFVTAKQARKTVGQLAAGLKHHGLMSGDCVSIHSFNNVLYPLLWLGVIAAGGYFSGGNPAYSTPELLHHFNITGAKYVLVHVDCFGTVVSAALSSGIEPTNIFIYDDSDVVDNGIILESAGGSGTTLTEGYHVSWLSSLLERGDTLLETLSTAEDASERIAIYAITSGTTGLPKAAALSHQYLVAQCVILENEVGGRAKQVSQLVCLPVFHAFAAQLALVLPLRTGIPTYFLPRFRLDDYVEAVSRFKITDCAVVPPIVTTLLSLDHDQYVKLQSLRYVICAGAPMNADVQNRLYRLLSPKVTIGQCWGATEAGWITLFSADEKDYSGSVGRLLPNSELKIVDEVTGSIIDKEGIAGEALIRSTSIFKRYQGNQEASANAIDEEGFYRTGDKVWIKDGKVFIGGRIKDTMKVNGWQVSPEELEEVIMRHQKVIDCAVTGVIRKDTAGVDQTLPRAFVVIARGTEISEEEIKSFVAAQVVGYKRLTGGVAFVSHIPRNPTGKILRRLLLGD